MTADPTKDREARRAAAKAAAVKYGPAATVTVAQIEPGDFVVIVPTQERIRGTRFDCIMTAVDVKHGVYRYTGRGGPDVPAVALKPANPAYGTLIYPAHFLCTIRKPQTQGEQQ